MGNEQYKKIFFLQKQFKKALYTLEEAVSSEYNVFVRDAIIKRFEYTFEISWHFMRAIIQYEGTKVDFPRDTIRKAFASGWIHDVLIWEEMLDDRDSTVHIYKELNADDVYHRIVDLYVDKLIQFKHKIGEVLDDLAHS